MDFDTPDVMTRTQLLTQRGYPAEVIAGNGHAQAAALPPEPLDEPTNMGRSCLGCGHPLSPRQERYCCRACSSRALAATGRDAIRRRRATQQQATQSLGGFLAWANAGPADVEAFVIRGGWQLVRTPD
jgi:hypothetical protein